jgi:hypothetical protein
MPLDAHTCPSPRLSRAAPLPPPTQWRLPTLRPTRLVVLVQVGMSLLSVAAVCVRAPVSAWLGGCGHGRRRLPQAAAAAAVVTAVVESLSAIREL